MGLWVYKARGECAHEPREWEIWTLVTAVLGAAALVFVLSGLFPVWEPKTPVPIEILVQLLGVGWVLYALALIDGLTLTVEPLLVALGLVFRLGMVAAFSPQELGGYFLSALAAAGAFHLVAMFYELLRGKEGLGQGDASVMALIGACVGLQGLPMVVLLAALGGIALAMGRRINPIGDPEAPIPFVPFLAGGGMVVWVSQVVGLV